MSHLEIILPFAIPPAPLAKDIQKELHTPSLSTLIGKAKRVDTYVFDEFSKHLPHEYLLAEHFPLKSLAPSAESHPSNTRRRIEECCLTLDTGFWFTVHPVHIHIARDHLVMTDRRRLHITETESRALFDEAKKFCEEIGNQLVYGDATTWFLRADDWSDMATASPDAACGHNIDIWMAKGTHERAWRKLQNEIQMQWFIHPINAEREERGSKPINSVWLSDGVLYHSPDVNSYGTAFGASDKLESIISHHATHQRILLDPLLEPALNSDWGQWLERMHELESAWFTPLFNAIKAKQVQTLQLIVTDAHHAARFELSTWSLRKFWQVPTIQHLFDLAKA